MPRTGKTRSHATEKLGTVDFPTSCATSQQAAFNRGVALLHDFWYDKAEQQFKDIVAADPTCAIAYWGEAMSQWHQIWDRPNAATMQRGLALVQKGQKLGAKTQRERDYIDALALFYQNSDKASFEVRVAAYSQAMEKLHEKYPQDHEATAFYGLALLAAAPPRDTTFANQKKALGLLNAEFPLAPDNPGISHYIIHACDSSADGGGWTGGGTALRTDRPFVSARGAHAGAHLCAAWVVAGRHRRKPRVGRGSGAVGLDRTRTACHGLFELCLPAGG